MQGNKLIDYFNDVKKVYNSISDDISRKIYLAKLQWVIDRNEKDFLLSVENTEAISDWIFKLHKFISDADNSIVMFGAGNDGRLFHKFLQRHDINASIKFCDNNKSLQGSLIDGIEVLAPVELIQAYKASAIVITTTGYSNQIKNQLINMNISEKRIMVLEPYLIQYFDVWQPVEQEIFLDAGCYDCATAIKFTQWCNNEYQFIYAFEPSKKSALHCMQVIGSYPIKNIHLINKGLWNKSDIMFFGNEDQGFSIDHRGDERIEVTSIDNALQGKKVTFVKMDIEGSEMEALIGASETIKRHKPRIAVCIYHKPMDVLDIPSFLLHLVPEYRFYLRHYSFDMRETVLYAYIP